MQPLAITIIVLFSLIAAYCLIFLFIAQEYQNRLRQQRNDRANQEAALRAQIHRLKSDINHLKTQL